MSIGECIFKILFLSDCTAGHLVFKATGSIDILGNIPFGKSVSIKYLSSDFFVLNIILHLYKYFIRNLPIQDLCYPKPYHP